ncbi:MAG: glycoside hydrolase family 127 protein [Sedimentisphaerales bacterium]|nr:glycoside hydrolase family 127 protein [Sedimentisphaerales bacterium]
MTREKQIKNPAITISMVGLFLLLTGCQVQEPERLKAVPFTEVTFDDEFWTPRMKTNREVTIPYDFKKCEETGRIDNFARAGGLMEGKFEGIRFNDSDVFKVIEGAAYSLQIHPDSELEKYLDDLIAKIAAAQEEDGYLYTCRTIDPNNLPKDTGETRWSFLQSSHELYNVGHMYEAAVAHYQATGKRTLLDVAIKNADLIDRVFGPGKKRDVPGHEEIEIGLVKLYGVTGDEKYLALAKFFLDERGRANGRKVYGQYCQDHKPVTRQNRAVGHAVRAGYLYTGMADVAALVPDTGYTGALDRIWQDVVSRKLYITGGIGARSGGESFGEGYELPNKEAYCETCAAIANAMWNHRMSLLHADAKYIDVLERVIYNGFLSGISLSGDKFFYPNPLASDGKYQRSPWFGCACCPTNIVRFLPSLPGYAYAQNQEGLYVNLFVSGSAAIKMGTDTLRVTQQTRYPWEGHVKIMVEPSTRKAFTIGVRIPGWTQESPVPSDLYLYSDLGPKDWDQRKVTIKVNSQPVALVIVNGYVRIHRVWNVGDVIELNLPMPVRRVRSHWKVKANTWRIALQRGPVVYCFEGADNPQGVSDLILPPDATFRTEYRDDLLGGVVILTGQGKIRQSRENDKTALKDIEVTAIPYYAWAHRGKNEMAVWLKESDGE